MPAAAPQTADELLADCERLHLLEREQLDEARTIAGDSAHALTDELVHRGRLTGFQADALLQGRGDELLLGGYVLLDKLGEGGMGAVYKARAWKLGQTVALKVIRKGRLDSPQVVARFQREIRASALLDHPNIVRALDADSVDDRYFLVMEYVEGVDLARLVRERGPLPIPTARDCVRQAALGLQHAFEKGLIHRDLKPSNLLLASGSTVKIADFGLALLTEADSDGERTATGVVLGTPDYMAPEQTLGSHHADIRADLYALGCTLWFLLCGRPPFPRRSMTQKLQAHQSEEAPAIETLRPDVPAGLAAIIRKLMAKSPADRFQTPADLVRALDAPEQAPRPFGDIPEAPRQAAVGLSPQARRWAWVSALAGLLLMGILGVVLRPRIEEPEDKPELAPPTPSLDRLRADTIPSRERDGVPIPELVAVLGQQRQRQWESALCVAIDPDGRFVVSGGRDKMLRTWDSDTMSRQDVRREPNSHVNAVAISPDGKRAASTAINHQLLLWRVEGSRLRIESSGGHEGEAAALVFTEGGRTLVQAGKAGKVHLWDVSAGTWKAGPVLKSEAHPVWSVTASADGTTIVSGGTAGLTRWIRIAAGYGPPSILDTEPASAVALSADGKTLAVVERAGALRMWDLAGGAPRKGERGEAENRDGIPSLALAPAGDRLALGRLHGGVELWQTHPKLRRLRVLPTNAFTVQALAFSKDGKRLVSTGEDGLVRLWRLDQEDGERFARIDGPVRRVNGLVFLGDGTMLAVANELSSSVRLWDLGNPEPRPRETLSMGPAAVESLASSTERNLLAVVWGGGPVRFWDTASQPPAELLPLPMDASGPGRIALSSDGTTLAAIHVQQGVQLWRQHDAAWSGPVSLPNPPKQGLVSLALSPDGRRLAAGSIDGIAHVWDVGDPPRYRGLTDRHPNTVHAVVFSPDGSRLVSSGADKVFLSRLPASDTEMIHRDDTLEGHQGEVRALAISPDGRRLASASTEGLVRVWDLETSTRKPLRNWLLDGPVYRLAFAPDSRHLAIGNGNGTVYIVRLGSK